MRKLLIIFCLVGLTGCATIMSERTEEIYLKTTPANPTVSVKNHSGLEVISGTAPMKLTLEKKRGFWRAEDYTIIMAADGHKTRSVKIERKINPWYFGNFILGGPLGFFIVDPYTGAMWRLSAPEYILLDEQIK